MSSNTDDQLAAMQQRLLELEQFITQQQQAPAQPSPEHNESMPDIDPSLLHSLEVRPSYTWQPSPFLQEQLGLDIPLFLSEPIPDEERRRVIESYPAIQDLQYQPPETVPEAARRMNKVQQKHDMSLKRLQYLLSAVFRPLDVLAFELSSETANPNLQRYFHMIADVRRLLLHTSSNITQLRNNIALQAINPSFSAPSTTNQNYTMSREAFQSALVQQTSTMNAIRNASSSRNSFRRKPWAPPQSSQAASTANNPQFFRSGPSSQHGGYNGNTTSHNNNRGFNQPNPRYQQGNKHQGPSHRSNQQ